MIDNLLVISGGMGTGKSTVLNLFEKNGFIIVNSDNEVSNLFKSEYSRYKDLAKDFDDWLGTDFVNKNEIDKKILRPYLEKAENGFSKALHVVKPYISERLNSLASEYSNQKIVFEIPLLFEAGMEINYKNILVVTAPLETRIERIKLRQPHLSEAQILQTINSQLNDEIKIKKATYVINNDSTLLKLEEDFNRLLPEFLNIYSQKNKTILKKNF